MIPLPPMVRRIQADRMVKQQRWAEAYDLYCAAASTYPERMPAAACWQDAAGMAGGSDATRSRPSAAGAVSPSCRIRCSTRLWYGERG